MEESTLGMKKGTTMEKCCVIDIGTNSIRMLVARLEEGYITDSIKNIETTRIGEGVDKTKLLSPQAIDRSIAALKKFKHEAINKGITNIRAIATSAVRDAENRSEFLERVRNELNIDIEVISGKKEAELGFMGVVRGIDKKLEELLVIDIGGGSTEFILGDNAGIKYLKSIDIGAVRMTDKHIFTDPATDFEMYNLNDDINTMIGEVIEDIKKFEIKEVAGIGGTVTSLGSIAQGLEVYDRNKVHNYELSIEQINGMVNRFKNLNNTDRKRIKGLQPKRADIILAGSKILYGILTALDIKKIRISEYDNLEGYVYSEVI
ncbi:MAG: Ppx/GppA family phosphatase [Clostridia bacterium]|nr:Ppx/GppA family phosphatase [Clostridia bacterium]